MPKGADFTIMSLLHFWLINFKHQILRNLPKAAWMFIPCFPNNFVITKSHPSLSNTEILCKLFLAIVCHSYDWWKSFNTEKHLSKMKNKYRLFRNFAFFKDSYVRKAYCTITKELLPLLPRSLLNPKAVL